VARIDTLLRNFQQLTEQIAELNHMLKEFEQQREDVRKELRTLAANSPSERNDETTDSADKSTQSTSLAETAKAVDELDCEVDAKQLASKLDLTLDAARLRLARTAKANLIVRKSSGRYVSRRYDEAHEEDRSASESELPLGVTTEE